MKHLKTLIFTFVIAALSFIIIPDGAKAITAVNENTGTTFSAQQHTEYVIINGSMYVITYDDDGKILLMEPVEE